MAAFLDGNLSACEMEEVSAAIASNGELGRFVGLRRKIDSTLNGYPEGHCLPAELRSEDFDIPNIEAHRQNPILAVAACNDADNLCDISCEGYIIRHFGVAVTDEELQRESIASGWLTSQGTPLQHIGKLSESHGLRVERKYHATMEDIAHALSQGAMVMACVDEGELTGNAEQEIIEDAVIGKRPDHVVIVSSIDRANECLTIIDPYTPILNDTYSQDKFADAWDDSNNYFIAITK